MIFRDVEWLVIMSRRAFRRRGRNTENTEICSTQDLADFKVLRIIGQAKRDEDNKWVLWGGYLFF
jgi:hypothetical protein